MPHPARAHQPTVVPHYRIEDPQTSLSIRLHSVPCELKNAPQIVARLDAKGTRFTTRTAAEQAFAQFCPGQVLEIARVDA